MERIGAGSVGPRLAGRLTAELILRSPQYMNCIKNYELDLRGNKIGAIENLGATENQFDSIDLSDNAVVKLEGFPKLPRLKALLLNNNRITRFARNLEEAIPNLEMLILTNNRVANITDIDPLATLPKLQHLSLLDCPVAKQPNYRLYVIYRCKHLKVLDFRKVKQKERDEAAAKFGTEEAGQAATFEPDEDLAQAQAQAQVAPAEAEAEAEAEPTVRAGPTAEQLTAIKAAIANAQTLEEVARLEAALRTGHLPSQVADPAAAAAAAANGVNGEAAAAMEEG